MPAVTSAPRRVTTVGHSLDLFRPRITLGFECDVSAGERTGFALEPLDSENAHHLGHFQEIHEGA